MKVLEAQGIRKRFGGVLALSSGDLNAEAGHITGLLGANGSGKSTMAKIISGVHAADDGQIRYEGQIVHFNSPDDAKRAGIAVVYQNLSLIGCLPVWQNVTLGMEEKRGLFLDNERGRALARRLLGHLLPGLDVETIVSRLSPAERQLVEIAKALAGRPKLLILDEPTAALNIDEVKTLFGEMRDLARQGVAMVFTSHRLWEVSEICDDVVVFRNGETVAEMELESGQNHADRLVQHITGRSEARTSRPRGIASRGRGDVVLRASDVSQGNTLRNVGLTLHRGEILGIGGLAEQGQRELMLGLAGYYRNLGGSVEISGRRVELKRPADAIRHKVVLVPGDREAEGLFPEHSVASNLIFPRYGRSDEPVIHPIATHRGLWRRAVNALAIKVGSGDVPVRTLSGGNQQKVVVGKWLSFDVDVLLLCDPAKGVDVGAKEDLYAYVVELAREKGAGVILYASDNEELVDHCDRVAVMYEGTIVDTLEGDDVDADTIAERSVVGVQRSPRAVGA